MQLLIESKSTYHFVMRHHLESWTYQCKSFFWFNLLFGIMLNFPPSSAHIFQKL